MISHPLHNCAPFLAQFLLLPKMVLVLISAVHLHHEAQARHLKTNLIFFIIVP